MKKFIFIFAAALAANFINAQLKVDSLGYVIVNKNLVTGANPTIDNYIGISHEHTSHETQPYFGIKSVTTKNSSMPTKSIYAVCGIAQSTYGASGNYHLRTIGVVGIDNHTYNLANDFASGVVGIGNVYNGIGVFGGIYPNGAINSIPTQSFGTSFAGYFHGNVKITGTLTATTVTQTSDERLKDGIKSLPEDLSLGLLNLNPVSFKYTKDSLYYWFEDDAEAMTHSHYGLVAQEVKEEFPDLVYTDSNGMLSVNYIELIPLLISTVKQQNAQIKEQDLRISELEKPLGGKTRSARHAASSPEAMEATEAVLLQNTPNPFSEQTEIGYTLPNDVQDAAIYIYDMQGVQLQKHELASRGSGTLAISGGTLRAGMYLYSLVADGKLIDTKRMILTE